MTINFKAFTAKANGLVRELVSPAKIFTSEKIAKLFNIKRQLIDIKAIWDTGATGTAISSNAAKRLNLKPISKVPVQGVHGSLEVNVYTVDITLPNNVAIAGIQVTEAKNIGTFDMLIGMDIITLGDFSITNANQKTCFSFRVPPDISHIDYAVQARSIREKAERRKKNKQKRKKKK